MFDTEFATNNDIKGLGRNLSSGASGTVRVDTGDEEAPGRPLSTAREALVAAAPGETADLTTLASQTKRAAVVLARLARQDVAR